MGNDRYSNHVCFLTEQCAFLYNIHLSYQFLSDTKTEWEFPWGSSTYGLFYSLLKLVIFCSNELRLWPSLCLLNMEGPGTNFLLHSCTAYYNNYNMIMDCCREFMKRLASPDHDTDEAALDTELEQVITHYSSIAIWSDKF